MPDSNQNIVEFRLTGTLSTSGTSVTVSNDIHRDSAIAVTDASVTLINEQGTVFELVKCTIAAGTLTTSKRGLTQAQTLTEDATLKREWRPGTKGFVTSFASDTLDREGDTMTGALSFSGTTNSGIRTSNLTTAQRLALTPANGMIVYDTTLGEHYQYIGGAWSAMASGSVQPNASATVAGKVEIATTAQSIAGTDTGETGALLSALPSDIAKNTQSGTFVYGADAGGDDTYVVALTPVLTAYTTGQKLTAKLTTANTGACTIDFGPGVKSIKLIDGTDPLDGDIAAGCTYDFIYDGTNMVLQSVAVRATDSDYLAGTSIIKVPTVAQLRKGIESTVTTMNSTQSGSAATTTSSTLLATKNYLALFSIALSSAETGFIGSAVIQYSLDGSTNWTTISSHTMATAAGQGTDSCTYSATVPLLNGVYYRSQSTTTGASACSASVTMLHLVQF